MSQPQTPHMERHMPTTQQIHFLGIDVDTRAHKSLLRFLNRKGIINIQDNGRYGNSSECSQVFVDCFFTEAELDTLLYENFTGYKGSTYLGVFTRRNYKKEDGYLFDKNEAVPLSIINS